MKQTAVEWLKVTVKSMIENGEDADLYAVLWHIEQAKEMEKQQIIDARVDGDTWSTAIKEMRTKYAELYYNETFNTNEE